jgi:hypothetical protein
LKACKGISQSLINAGLRQKHKLFLVHARPDLPRRIVNRISGADCAFEPEWQETEYALFVQDLRGVAAKMREIEPSLAL